MTYKDENAKPITMLCRKCVTVSNKKRGSVKWKRWEMAIF